MKRIIISEKDLTSNVEVISSYDVAYVPGFTSVETAAANYYQKPTLFTNKFEFQKAIGYSPAMFATDQPYPTAGEGVKGFSTDAIPEDNVMFRAGATDSGYRIALYLLSLGLPVYYEVMNDTLDKITVTDMYAGLEHRFVEDTDNSFDTPGDYAIKFITSGGYPVFEYGPKDVSNPELHTDIVALTSSNWNSDTNIITCTTKFVPDDDTTNIDIIYTKDNNEINITDSFTIIVDKNKKTIKAELKSDADLDTKVSETFTPSKVSISYAYYGTEAEDDGHVDVTMTLMAGMLNLAHSRGDAIALIDHTNNPERPLTTSDSTSVISVVRQKCVNDDSLEYGAMFTPWYECSSDKIADNSVDAFVPGSVAYLSALAVQLRDYSPWLAVSGVTRGKVPNLVKLHTTDILTNNIADSYQTIPGESAESLNIIQMSINPITYIRNVGYCIWGDRTLRNNSDGTTALSFLHIRSAVSDVKKLIYETSQKMLFEQNTSITWLNFKSAITPLLDRMVSNYVLEDYSIVRYMVDPESGNPVPAYKVLGVIKIRPINSIEVFDLTVQLENTAVTMAEM